ncbi:MAG: PIG-L deacetylase family protein [Anaerolineales bacterium]
MNLTAKFPSLAGLPKAAIVVAHPDDETLWAGGFVLEHFHWNWHILSLCRGSDPDRAPKFACLLQQLSASGVMADLDDGPEQRPLSPRAVQQQVLKLLPRRQFDVVLTHGPLGEYTWHRRHVEVCQAVTTLWQTGQISAKALWWFAYEDGGRQYLPRGVRGAHLYQALAPETWRIKHDLVTQVYGFSPESWEARTTPRAEAFWCFQSPRALEQWLSEREMAI